MSDSPPRTQRRLIRALVSLSLAAMLPFALLAGCNERRAERAVPSAAGAQPRAKSQAKPQFTHRQAPVVPLEQFVQQHVEEADATGMRVLVYVGASWCEPCQRFHKALASGELDEALAGTKFLEFDADRDRAELRSAGYAVKNIPLFAVPDQSGHASELSIEGSIKGDSAVREHLVPRLLALLDGKVTR
ncbi:MAG TPA: thioredoxin family protein [Polyangiaceae bacterium]